MPELCKRIETTIAAIPPDHWVRLKKNELFADPETAYIRIRDWGFTQGIHLVKESTNSRKGRWQIDCSRYHKETRNSRKTPLEERKRLGTHSQASNCKLSLYISQRKRLNNQWAIGWTYDECNHPCLADPFLLDGLKIYELNYQKAR